MALAFCQQLCCSVLLCVFLFPLSARNSKLKQPHPIGSLYDFISYPIPVTPFIYYCGILGKGKLRSSAGPVFLATVAGSVLLRCITDKRPTKQRRSHYVIQYKGSLGLRSKESPARLRNGVSGMLMKGFWFD